MSMANPSPEAPTPSATLESKFSLSPTRLARSNFLGMIDNAFADAERNEPHNLAVITTEGPPDNPLTESEILASFGPTSTIGQVDQNRYGIILPGATSLAAMQQAIRFLKSRSNIAVGMGIYFHDINSGQAEDSGGKTLNRAEAGLKSSQNKYPGKVVVVASLGQSILFRGLTPEEKEKIKKDYFSR